MTNKAAIEALDRLQAKESTKEYGLPSYMDIDIIRAALQAPSEDLIPYVFGPNKLTRRELAMIIKRDETGWDRTNDIIEALIEHGVVVDA